MLVRIMASPTPPLTLDMSSRSSGKTPEGKTVPLAWDLTTQKIYMKTADGMPWDDSAKVAAIVANGGTYLAASDEWFRGVWELAPQVIMDADYTRKQLGGATGAALLGDGGDGGDDANAV